MRLSEAPRWIRQLGWRTTIEGYVGQAARRATGRLNDRVGAPALDELRELAGGRFDLSTEAVLAHFGITMPAALARELAEVARQLERRFQQTNRHPAEWRVEAETGSLLYALVRTQQPEVVVETGVAAGTSAFVILEALARNDRGRLHSFDVDTEVGELVTDRSRWSLTILPQSKPQAALRAALGTIGGIDLFLHDGDHEYPGQLFDLRLGWRHLGAGGFLVCDDADDSRAFQHFCAETPAVESPSVLFDHIKLVGVASKHVTGTSNCW